jgi:hypothetical protein
MKNLKNYRAFIFALAVMASGPSKAEGMLKSCDRLKPSLKAFYEESRTNLDTNIQSITLHYAQDSTDNKRQCYKVNNISSLSRKLSSLIFTGSDTLDENSKQTLDQIVSDLSRQYGELPEAQKKSGLELNVSGHTGMWSHENFLRDLSFSKGSISKKQMDYLIEQGNLPKEMSQKVSGFLLKVKSKPLHDFTDEEYRTLEDIQLQYFNGLSAQRADKICSHLKQKLLDIKFSCLPEGKGTQESPVSYDRYIKLGNEKQRSVNQELRRVTATLSVQSAKEILKDGREEIKTHDVYYTRTKSSPNINGQNMARAERKQEFNKLLKEQYPDGSFDHCLSIDSDFFEDQVEVLNVKTNFGEVEISQGSFAGDNTTSEKTVSVPLNFFNSPFDQIKELSRMNGKYYTGRVEVSEDVYNLLDKQISDKLPDLEKIWQVARAQSDKEFNASSNCEIQNQSNPMNGAIGQLADDMSQAENKVLTQDRFCDGFEKVLAE